MERKKIDLVIAKDSEEKDLIDMAYHDFLLVQEIISKQAGLNDIDFERWEEMFCNDLKRWEEK